MFAPAVNGAAYCRDDDCGTGNRNFNQSCPYMLSSPHQCCGLVIKAAALSNEGIREADAAADAALEYARSLPPGQARSDAFKEA
jgi:hypothetical protein